MQIFPGSFSFVEMLNQPLPDFERWYFDAVVREKEMRRQRLSDDFNTSRGDFDNLKMALMVLDSQLYALSEEQ